MPRCKGYLSDIDRFYKWTALDHICFGYVQGMKRAIPSITAVKAIELFLEEFEIDEDTYCFETAKASYYRVLKSFKALEHKYGNDSDLT